MLNVIFDTNLIDFKNVYKNWECMWTELRLADK
jgi:hypothetical protein